MATSSPAGIDVFGSGVAAAYLSRVAERMAQAVGEDDPRPAARAALAAVSAPGKRLRPLLALAGAPAAARSDSIPVVAAGAAVELVHTASLVHDDLLDEAPLRRGVITTHEAWGTDIATAAGDLLFSCAFQTLLALRQDLGDEIVGEAISLLALVSRQLAEGEALQAAQHRDLDVSVGDLLRRSAGKTGVLFGASVALGALLGGRDPETCARLSEYGTTIGTAFQLVDDALDLQSGEATDRLGKIPGVDLRDGTVTLPLLLALPHDTRIRQLVMRVWDCADAGNDAGRDAAANAAISLISEAGAIEATLHQAQQMCGDARALIAEVSDADRAPLVALADMVIERSS